MQTTVPGVSRAVTVNGQDLKTGADTLEALLEELVLKGSPLVAEVDGSIIKPEDFALTPIRGGERIELVRFVGGG
ncbi:MAG: sulfur carrier protein ThiS [Desulfovibrionaceae bacterium]|nr:sulfur carrier protein ThiS [Desulfovibrionaceae bacterium]